MQRLLMVCLVVSVAAVSSASAIGAQNSSVKRQLTGKVTAVGASITVRSQSRSLTCSVVSRGGLRTFAGRMVRLTCRTVGGRLTATRIRTVGSTKQSIEVEGGRAEVRGQVTSVAGGFVTVGLGQSSFSCRIPGGLDLSLFLGRTVELECVLVDGVFTVQEIETEDGLPEIEVEFQANDDNGDVDHGDEDHSGPGRGGDD